MKPIIWHNPKCSKSRETLKILQDRGIEPDIRRYLEDPPSEEEIRAAIRVLGRPVPDLVRKQEPDYKTAGLGPDSGDDELISAMARHPRLIERPIVFVAAKARIGRPPETILELLT